MTLSGIPASGADMISLRIVPAPSTRSITLSRSPCANTTTGSRSMRKGSRTAFLIAHSCYRKAVPSTQTQLLRIELRNTRLPASLLRFDHVMRDGMDREGDAVLHTHLTHQLSHMGFHRAFFNPQRRPDLLVGASGDQHLENVAFALGERDPAGRENTSRGSRHAFDEDREHAPWRPHRSLKDDADRLYEFFGRGGLVHIALGARRQRFEDQFIVGAAAADQDPESRPRSLQAGHQVEQVLGTVTAQQGKIDLRLGDHALQSCRHQFEVRLSIKQGAESYEPQ